MAAPHPLGHAPTEVLAREAGRRPYDVPLLARRVEPQPAQRALVEGAPPQHARGGHAQATQEPYGPVPVQAVLPVPHREPVEPAVQVLVRDRMPGVEVLPAHPPPGRDPGADAALEALDPRPRGVVRRVERARVQAVRVEGGVLPVELLGHHDLASGQPRQSDGPDVVRRRPGGPGEVRRTGIVDAHDPLLLDIGCPVTVGSPTGRIHPITLSARLPHAFRRPSRPLSGRR